MNATLTRTRPSALTSGVRLLLFGRVVPAVFFAMLGYIQLTRLIHQLHDAGQPVTPLYVLSKPLPTFLYLLFCAIPVFIYVSRPAPRARDARMLPRAAGLIGTVMLLVVGAVPQWLLLYNAPAWLDGVSTVITIFAFALAVYGLLYLRRSLSLMPEARRLVTGGPYRVVRHPLYGAEMMAAFAFAIVNPYVVAAITLLPFFAIQVIRAGYEEALLTSVFPEYATYAQRTHSLIPFAW